MTKTKCFREPQVRDYALGALDEEQRTAIEQHLLDCPACRKVAVEAESMNRVLADYLEARRETSQAGPHLDDHFLHRLSRGQVDFASIREENSHLADCSLCFGRLRKIEDQVYEEMRSRSNRPVAYPAADYLLEELTMAADSAVAEDILQFRIHDSIVGLLSCREFQAELFCSRNQVYLGIWTDEPESLGPVCVRHSEGSEEKVIDGDVCPAVRIYRLGPITALHKQEIELSFDYEDETWSRRVQFD